jgi:hypothetical protein
MTEGTRYNVTFTHFARYLGASPADLPLPCIHRGTRPMEPSAMKFMYPRNKQANAGYAGGSTPTIVCLTTCFVDTHLGAETQRISLTLLRTCSFT